MNEKTQKKGKRKARKLNYAWRGNAEKQLISAVKKRRSLWDSNCPEYKMMGEKCQSWEEVVNELCIDGVDVDEAKIKWNCMRSNFKMYLAKFKKEGKPINSVTWPHFNDMFFIEQAANSTSLLTQNASTTDQSASEDTQDSKSFLQQLKDRKSIKRRLIVKQSPSPAKKLVTSTPLPVVTVTTQTSTETSTPVLSMPMPEETKQVTSSKAEVVHDFVPLMLSNVQQNSEDPKPKDRIAIFGDLIVEHLRNLPPNQSLTLESRLARTVYEFLDTINDSSTPASHT